MTKFKDVMMQRAIVAQFTFGSSAKKLPDKMLKSIQGGYGGYAECCWLLADYLSKYYVILFLFFLLSCTMNKETKDDILRIDIRKAENRTHLNASDFISSIEYVKLETSSNCLIGEIVRMSVSENYILTFSASNCFLFSREGKFIRSIGQRGNGPADFISSSYYVKIDEKYDMIYLMDYSFIYAYRITGEFVKVLNITDIRKKTGIATIWNVTHWKEDLFCGNIDLNSGKEPYRFIIFNLEGDVVKLFTNHKFFKPYSLFTTDNMEARIYCYNEQLFFKEMLSDTLFLINDQLELIISAVFDLPEPKITTSMWGQEIDIIQYNFIRRIYEIDNYILFTG